MKGVVYLGESEVEVRDFPDPEPGSDQVVIEMKVGGLCGSDLHKYHNTRSWAADREGMISGHEPTGIVAEVGAGVKNVSVGDRVCVYHRTGCGYCVECVSGTPAHCPTGGAFGRTQDGSHADYMLTDARFCLPLPDSVSFAVGTQLACTAGTAFAGASKISAHAGDTYVVFGLGPVGMTALLVGQGMGYDTIGVDVQPYRVALAERIGNGRAINAADHDPVEVIRDLTNGKGAAGVVECSGNLQARRQAAQVAGRKGTVVYVGAGQSELTINIGDLISKDITIRGNSVYPVGAYYDAVDFLQRNAVPLDDIVTHRYRIDQAVEAFQTFDAGETGKVVLEWE
jgi:(R,R)-butanediol dehydrogenase / meso-butanediol dehydrogenase / diacetyl reductase